MAREAIVITMPGDLFESPPWTRSVFSGVCAHCGLRETYATDQPPGPIPSEVSRGLRRSLTDHCRQDHG